MKDIKIWVHKLKKTKNPISITVRTLDVNRLDRELKVFTQITCQEVLFSF